MCIGNVTIEEGQVIAHRGMKNLYILCDHANMLTQIMQAYVLDRYSTKTHFAHLRIIETKQETGQRCLAAARAPYYAQEVPFRQVKRDVLYDAIDTITAGIAKRYVAEFDR